MKGEVISILVQENLYLVVIWEFCMIYTNQITPTLFFESVEIFKNSYNHVICVSATYILPTDILLYITCEASS